MSSAGPSSPTAVDGNSHFGFSDQTSVNAHVTEESQGLGLFQEIHGNEILQEFPTEGQQELSEPHQSPREPPVETSQPSGQEVVEEVIQPYQVIPDISQPCQKNQDTLNHTCPPCQKASELCQKDSKEVCQLCHKNHDDVSQPCWGISVEVGSPLHRVPVGGGDLVQETLVEVGSPIQEMPEEISQPCQEFSVEVAKLAQEAFAINLLSQDIPEVDKPPQDLPGETDMQVQEVPEEVSQQSWVVPEVTDQLSREDAPQMQCLSSDPKPVSSPRPAFTPSTSNM